MFGNKLFLIKLIHTTIFLLMSACVFYILYSGITKNYYWTVFLAIGAIFIEGIIVILNNWQCPLTNLARKYGDEKGLVTDMFFPKWFVPYVFQSCSVLFAIGLILLAVGYLIK